MSLVLDSDSKKTLLYRRAVSNLRTLTTTSEFGTPASNQTVALAYLFEFVKYELVTWLAELANNSSRKHFLLHMRWDSIEWCTELAKELFSRKSSDVVFWMFVHVPYFHRDVEPLGEWRSHYVEMLEVLEAIWPPDSYFSEREYLFMAQSACGPYPLAYHNLVNSKVLSRICRLIRKICPDVNYTNPRIRHQSSASGKIKICFVSDRLVFESSVLRDRMGVILGLDKTVFDVYYASTTMPKSLLPAPAYLMKELGANHHIFLESNNLQKARNLLADFDIIVYPDLGMKTFTTLLAYSRLAPIQITTWGHSDTSGIDTIDYYVSSEFFELPDAKSSDEKLVTYEHYSERLVLMSSLSTYYINPAKDPFMPIHTLKTRKDLGFKDSDHIYMCMQVSFKISEEFEDYLAEIINKDPDSKILMSLNIEYPRSCMKRFFSKITRNPEEHLVFYPTLSKQDFINLTAICDVMLDSYPFGGCNTSLEAFAYGIPVITRPTKFINGRFTYGFYKKMGQGLDKSELVVTSKEDYIKTALDIARNRHKRALYSSAILNGVSNIFEERESIEEWNTLLQHLCEKHYQTVE